MFIYSLPLFFTHIGLASPLDLLIIFMALFVVLFISSLFGGENPQKQSSDNYLFAAWNGSAPLRWAVLAFFSNPERLFVCSGYAGKNRTIYRIRLG